jgi:predicted transposase YbfD/YdcC
VLIQADALHPLAGVFQLTAEQGADMLLTVKNNQRRPYQQIASHFRENRHFHVVISDFETRSC